MNCPLVRRAFLLILFALACFAFSPQARATCQEGCLTNNNTVLGDDALMNSTGSDNTAIGADALLTNTTGDQNTATGFDALFSNTTGFQNTATGAQALFSNIIGSHNTAVGQGSLAANSDGHSNTATGAQALSGNRHGTFNTGVGLNALLTNKNGHSNTAVGNAALFSNTGSNNIGIGDSAGLQLTSGSNNIDIGNLGVRAEANTIRVGTQGTQTATYIAGISGATVPTGVAVIVDADGHLGTTTSSARFKEGIKPMDNASEAILALKPVTFRYKHEVDPVGMPQFGLVAEDVEKINADLVARNKDGKPYTVRYDAVNAMLLNEFLKEHCKVEEQERKIQRQGATIAQLAKGMKSVVARLEEQASQIQKMSAQLEVSKAAPQVVLNNQ